MGGYCGDKDEIYTFVTDYYNIEHINTQFDSKENDLDTYR